MGMISRDKKKIPRMLIEATIPNSRSKLLLRIIKVANPEAVVRFVIRVALPTLEITRIRERA
jgi:hypothetical protein